MSRIERLASAMGVNDAEASLSALRELYREVDEVLAERAASTPCRSGCSACCHEAVFVSGPEALAVAVELDGQGRLEASVDRMSTIARRFSDELELLEELPAGYERDEVAARVKFTCPLLDELGRCTVYGTRELNARTFGQSWDGRRAEPYGCALTQSPLRVLQAERPLLDARAARQALVDRVPGAGRVHVYPWWFQRLEPVLGRGQSSSKS